ncbi:hypothetical protein IWX81_001440 [Salinibacterium sp. CAN_S4]|uniref:hypothetical protein n=1 Tax=Salinibacterium sp. CAN_S4 TaxID=2787727 RepID=UPI0018EF4DF8
MADLVVDFDELVSTRSRIDHAVSTFQSVERVGHDISGLVGHSGLASKVNDFADSWDINRGKLTEALEFVTESLTAIIDTFRELDEAQAKAATTTTAPAPSQPSGSGGDE